MEHEKKMEDIIKRIQPFYDEINSKYSKSYLSGSIWYVGPNIFEWWRTCNNVRYYIYNITKLRAILEIIMMNKRNQLK